MIRSQNLRLFLYGLGIVAIQIILFRHLRVFGAQADLILIFILWVCTKNSKTYCLLLAASLGFLQDAMTDLWGLNMFSKTLIVFILHSYLNRISQNRLIFWQVLLIIFSVALLHNLILLGVSYFSDLYSAESIFWSFLLISPLFTALTGSFLHIVKEDSL
ncbi:MAG: rod shape-determining protein MreD [Balneolaceae bacterium]|nr:rod shape-determining protein MreD [Balneolaceae bacterium]